MLVLTRKRNQAIAIGGAIEVTILDIQGNRVKIGLTAPPDVAIRRNELGPPVGDLAEENRGVVVVQRLPGKETTRVPKIA